MIALVVSTLFSAAFALIMRFAQGKKCDLIAVGALNYLTAACFHWISAILAGGAAAWKPQSFLIGACGGFAYVSAYFLLFPLMRMRGVSISSAVMRLSVIVPVGVSIALWGESMNAVQAAGSILALASFPLLGILPTPSASAGPDPEARRQGRRAFLILLGLFVTNGLCLLTPRAYEQTGIRGQESAFLGSLFSVAAVVSGSVWALRTLRGHARGSDVSAETGLRGWTIACGIALGLSNALCNRGTVFALQRLPSIVVYPFYSAVGLALTVLVSRLAWKERFRAAEAAGLAAACAAALLVNAG